jgi:hypothetical protein
MTNGCRTWIIQFLVKVNVDKIDTRRLICEVFSTMNMGSD